MKPILLIFLLFAAPAMAADTGSTAQATADALLAPARIAFQQAQAALEAAEKQAALLAAQPVVPPDAAPVVVQGPIETKLSIPAQVRDDLMSAMTLIITGLIATGLAWMRSHLSFMRDLGMNQQITASAEGFGALLVQGLKQQGVPTTVDINNPQVAAFTRKVLDGYPAYVAQLGMTPEKISTLILKGAAKVLPATDPAPAVPVAVQVPQPVPVMAPAVPA